MSYRWNLAILVVAIVCIGACNAKSLVAQPQHNQSAGSSLEPQTTTTKRAFVCKCEDIAEPLCANNGVTYTNMCRFECAKHKVSRLRIVKEGECGKYLSRLQFWAFG
ncbi:Serine protease inhibitor dipetalogastin [Orchesella cincta]|uniref:Serine protease inhibitor dipetalogastin n=1 Tax=Orchesella cincta TaxID=48709 RepID=A0A1D2N6U0_ORCCI|nr:Serine protease inhibitor dipetalogastin [Orchesella cincta]